MPFGLPDIVRLGYEKTNGLAVDSEIQLLRLEFDNAAVSNDDIEPAMIFDRRFMGVMIYSNAHLYLTKDGIPVAKIPYAKDVAPRLETTPYR